MTFYFSGLRAFAEPCSFRHTQLQVSNRRTVRIRRTRRFVIVLVAPHAGHGRLLGKSDAVKRSMPPRWPAFVSPESVYHTRGRFRLNYHANQNRRFDTIQTSYDPDSE